MDIAKKLPALLAFLFVLAASCTKIETTDIGNELLPEVDNITTFDTVFEVVSQTYIPRDTTRLFYNDLHMAGGINNDPQFGTSKASFFFQPVPSFFPFTLGAVDSLKDGFDSAVVILSYVGYYGDSAHPVTFNMHVTDRKLLRDTSLIPTYTLSPNVQPVRNFVLGTKTIKAIDYNDTIAIKRGDSVYRKVTGQLRIRLNDVFARRLYAQLQGDGLESDTAFTDALGGLVIEPQIGANALHYFSLTDGKGGLEFYYRKKNGKIDTTSTLIGFAGNSGHAVRFENDRNGSEVMNYLTGDPVKGSSQVYIQTMPGTMAKVSVPGLKDLSNRVIHRAELRVAELTPTPAAGVAAQMLPPQILYLDLADTSNTFKGIPYDMAPLTNYFCFPSQNIEYFYFGGQSRQETISGARHYVYRFNISRYLQGVISRKEPYLDFRLSAPYYLYYLNCTNPNTTYPKNYFMLRNSGGAPANLPGNGQIRLAGGNHPNPNLRMQVRVIYSKI